MRAAVAGFVARVAAFREAEGSAAVVSRAADRLLAPLWVRLAGRRLRARLQEAPTRTEQMAVVHTFAYRRLSLRPSQIAAELTSFLDLVAETRPRAILEVGTALGGTTVLLAQVATDDALIISIDLPFDVARGPMLAAAARGSQELHCLRADSHEAGTRDAVRALLGGRDVDVLFIDGDHTTEGVRRDLELYGPLVRSGGWIAFHDIVPGPYEFVGGVPELWVELKAEGETREFVADWAQGGLGIGAFRKDGELATAALTRVAARPGP